MITTLVYLYRCFDREGQLLYVGITDDVERRKREHAKDKFWWRDVVRVTRMAFERRDTALWAEWAVISTCAPVYNATAPTPPVPGDAGASTQVGAPARRAPRPTPAGNDSVRRLTKALARRPAGTNAELARLANVSVATANRYSARIRRDAEASDLREVALMPSLPIAAPKVLTHANGTDVTTPTTPTKETS